jgi:Cu/Zn superoxide dismutase
MKRFTGVMVGTILLIALAIGTSAEAQEQSKEVDLTPSRNSGVSGTATFQDTDGGVEVKLNIQGAPEGGVEHLAHIHEGAT